MNTADLRRMLVTRHEPQAWALMFEVADGTGSNGHRWADAVAMSLWPSRGLGLHGYELKASRSDWLRELKSPQKAEAICKYCDHWWVVAGGKEIVLRSELPPTWGLLVAKSDKLIAVVDAPKLTPVPIDRTFLAALLRSAAKPAVKDDQTALLKARDQGRKDAEDYAERKYSNVEKALAELTKVVSDFEASAGFRISGKYAWPKRNGTEIGHIVRDVLAGKHDQNREDIERMRQLAAGVVEQIDASGILAEEAPCASSV